MPAPAHDMFTFTGIFGDPTAPAEIWSTSVKTDPAGRPSPSVDSASRAASLFADNLLGWMPGYVWLTNVRHSRHAAGGKVGRTGTGEFDQADAPVQVSGSKAFDRPWPLQTALVATLDSAFPGAAGKGRMFLPFPFATLTPGFTLSSSAASEIAVSVRTMLVGFMTQGPAGTGGTGLVLGRPVVVSAGPEKGTGPGRLSPITGVRVGVVPDTMRSRRSALPEGYQQVAL